MSTRLNDENFYEGDDVVTDFVETCGGIKSMKNLAVIYRLMALLEAEKDESSKTNSQENNFYESLNNRNRTLSEIESLPYMNKEPQALSGNLFLQINQKESPITWIKYLVVLQSGVLKCYDQGRKWQRSINLKGFQYKLTADTFIYLIPSVQSKLNSNEIVFESKDGLVSKWTNSLIQHIKYADSIQDNNTINSVQSDRCCLLNERDRNSLISNQNQTESPLASISDSQNKENGEPKILKQLRNHLMQTINTTIQETNDSEYKYGLLMALG